MPIRATLFTGLLCAWPLAAPAAAADISLADALAVIRAKPKVDLTHVFGPTTPVAASFGRARFTPAVDAKTLEAFTIAKDGFRATYYAMVGPYGTHIDAPARSAPLGKYLEDIALDEMILPLVVLDDTPYLGADPTHDFTLQDLAAWEARHGPVPRGAFAALRTDLAKTWTDAPAAPVRSPFPGWSLPVLKVLVEQRGVVAIGQESLATDATATMDGSRYVLNSGHWQIDALANLDKVPPTGAMIVASWPKPERGLGFPARVFAVLP